MKLAFLLCSVFLPAVTAFGMADVHPHPDLKKFAEANLGRLVQVRLDIGQRASKDRLSLQGPIIKFLDSVAQKIPLPVANGPNPHLSSGRKNLEVVKEGFVIDMNGLKNVPFKEGCWEMAWREGDNSGRILCAFDLPEPIQRNNIKIPACRVYLAFPVWTKETLVFDQATKKEVRNTRQELMAEKEHALEKMQATSNPFQRFLCYREAAAAFEKVCMLKSVSHIPEQDEYIELENGLIISKEGNLYKSLGPYGVGKSLLGSALLSNVEAGAESA